MYVPNLISRGRKPNRQASTWQTALHVPGKELHQTHAITLSLHPLSSPHGKSNPPMSAFLSSHLFTPPMSVPFNAPSKLLVTHPCSCSGPFAGRKRGTASPKKHPLALSTAEPDDHPNAKHSKFGSFGHIPPCRTISTFGFCPHFCSRSTLFVSPQSRPAPNRSTNPCLSRNPLCLVQCTIVDRGLRGKRKRRME